MQNKLHFIKLSTAVTRLQRRYGKDKIDRQTILDMLDVLEIQPYFSPVCFDDYYITSCDCEMIDDHIYDYKKGAPVNEIFNIGI